MIRVGEHVIGRQLRPVHPQRRQQPGSQVILPPGAGEHLHEVACHQVAQVAVLERLAQVLAQRQEPQPADHLGAGPARMTEPGQVMAGKARPVGQQVDDAQAIGHHRIVQPELRQVIPKRAFPLKQAIIDQGTHGRHREGLRGRPDGQQRVRGDRQTGLQVPPAPPCRQDDIPVPDTSDRASRDLHAVSCPATNRSMLSTPCLRRSPAGSWVTTRPGPTTPY